MLLLVGTIAAYGGDLGSDTLRNALQANGWLLCNGATYDSSDYPDLYDLIRVLHNAYPGSRLWVSDDQFKVPDMRGRFVRSTQSTQGVWPGKPLDDRTAPPLQGSGFETNSAGAHRHEGFMIPPDSASITVVAGNELAAYDTPTLTGAGGAHSHTVNSGGDAESRPINVYVDFIIYAGVSSATGGQGAVQ